MRSRPSLPSFLDSDEKVFKVSKASRTDAHCSPTVVYSAVLSHQCVEGGDREDSQASQGSFRGPAGKC